MSLSFKTIEKKENEDWLVFIHGLGGNYNIFYKQFGYFEENFNLLLIDLPGHGESMPTPKKDTLSFTIKKINELLIDLNIHRAHFMGVSLGTIVLQEFSVYYPQKIKSMVLAGAVDKWKKWGYLLANLALTFPIKNIIPYQYEYKLFAWILMPKKNHKKSRDIFIKEANKLGKSDYLNWVKVAKGSANTNKKINQMVNNIPKLYISGDQDHMFLPSISTHLNSEINSELVIIKNCGHVCNIEKADEFNILALEYLTGQKKTR